MKTCFVIIMVDTYGEEHIAGVTMTEEKAEAKVEEFKKNIRETKHYDKCCICEKTAGRLTVNVPSAIITTARLRATTVAGSKKSSRTTHIFI